MIIKKKKKRVVFTRKIETDRETDRTVHGKTLSYRQPYDDFGFIPFEIHSREHTRASIRDTNYPLIINSTSTSIRANMWRDMAYRIASTKQRRPKYIMLINEIKKKKKKKLTFKEYIIARIDE